MKLLIKKYLSWLVFLATLLMLSGCDGGGNIVDELLDQFNHKAITSFSFPSKNGPVSGVIAGNNISVVMPYNTNTSSLVASFTTTGDTVTINGKPQVSGMTINNFTTPVVYTVTAIDRTIRNYTVTVTAAKAENKAITAYSLQSANGPVNGVIAGDSISVTMPYGSNVNNLIANFTSNGVNVKVGDVTEISGKTVNNFTTPIVYTVYAADGTSKDYTVTVTVAKSSSKVITSFSLDGTSGIITGNSISVVMPYGTNISDLIATFTTSGSIVKVGTTTEVSGQTANNFTSPVTYTVTAADGSTKNYTVTVSLAANPAKSITSYSIDNVNGVIGSNTINVNLPYGTNVTDLVATFTTSGVSVKVGATTEVSGQTANNFTSPVTYTVTAADGSTKNYTVTVTLAANPAKAITSYSIDNVNGVISGNNINVELPYGTNVTDLVATFTTSGSSVKVGSTIEVSGQTANNFTSPVTYTVTAADGSIKNYTVTVTLAANPAKSITSYSIDNKKGVIGANTINVTLPYGTDVTDLVATFTSSGVSVKVGNTTEVSGQTANNFTNPVTYTVTAADGSAKNYIVTVTVAATNLFVAYYPENCTLGNAAANIPGNCTCIKDSLTGNIWTTGGNESLPYESYGLWTDWCNHTSGTIGYDENCPTFPENKLDAWNNTARCGLTGEWHLPTSINADAGSLSGTNPGGDWSDLYNVAISGSYPPGNAYTNNGKLGIWMNNNGFEDICSSGSCNSFYWSSQSLDNLTSWGVDVTNPQMSVGGILQYESAGILLVHSVQ